MESGFKGGVVCDQDGLSSRFHCSGYIVTSYHIHWTPEGKRERGRPKTTWRRTVEAEMKKMNHGWGTITEIYVSGHHPEAGQ